MTESFSAPDYLKHEIKKPDNYCDTGGERKAETPIRGKLQILLEKSLHLGREVCVAKVMSTTGGSDVMCAPLYDAQVIYLLDGKMRIRGFEMMQISKRPVQFQTFYQTWEIELR